MLAAVAGHNVLHFQSFKGGISFGTSRFDERGSSSTPKGKKGKVAPITGKVIAKGKTSTHFTTRLVPHIDDDNAVPVYDGRGGFQIGHYWEHPYDGEVTPGSTVLLLFTIRKGNLAKGMEAAKKPEGVKFGIYLLASAVVVLADPVEAFTDETSLEPPAAFGVDEILQFPEADPNDVDNSDSSDSGAELEEAVL